MNETTRLQPMVKLALVLAGLVSTLPSCATYKQDQMESTDVGGDSGGAGGGDIASVAGGGSAQAEGGGGSPASGGAAQAGMNGIGGGAAVDGGRWRIRRGLRLGQCSPRGQHQYQGGGGG